MATMRILDRSGDTRHEFTPGDAASELSAMMRFNELVKGKRHFAYAAEPGKGGTRLLREFDPNVAEIVLSPALAGG